MNSLILASPFIGFTGTQGGMTARQRDDLEHELRYLWRCGARVLRHGLCIGADEEAHDIATAQGYATWGHPGFALGHPKRSPRRTTWTECVQPPLERNHIIVDRVSVMLAAPKSKVEVLRSGTWATIRYIRRRHVEYVLLTP